MRLWFPCPSFVVCWCALVVDDDLVTRSHYGIMLRSVNEIMTRLLGAYEGVKLRITYLELYNEASLPLRDCGFVLS